MRESVDDFVIGVYLVIVEKGQVLVFINTVKMKIPGINKVTKSFRLAAPCGAGGGGGGGELESRFAVKISFPQPTPTTTCVPEKIMFLLNLPMELEKTKIKYTPTHKEHKSTNFIELLIKGLDTKDSMERTVIKVHTHLSLVRPIRTDGGTD